MRNDAKPKPGTIRDITKTVAECANCGGPIRATVQIYGISGIPLWTHDHGGSIPNYACVTEHEKDWMLTGDRRPSYSEPIPGTIGGSD